MAMNLKIGVISPQPHLTKLVASVAATLPDTLVIQEAVLEQAASAARAMEADGVKAIVSRMPTLAFVRRVATVPTVPIEITSFDLLRAFHRASSFSREVAWFFYYKDAYRYDVTSMEAMLNIKVRKYPYRTQQELFQLLDEASSSGVSVVVGTGRCIIEAASKMGLKGVLVESSKEAVMEALERAKQLMRYKMAEERKSRVLWAVTHSSAEGIVAVDSDDRITIFNPSSVRLLGVPAEDVLGRKLSAVPSLAPLAEIASKCQETTGHGAILRSGDSSLWVNCVPITVDDEAAGIVFRILEIDRIQNLERRVRKELHQKGLTPRYRFDDILGTSSKIQECKRTALRYSKTDSTVLITGESGTGKELFAHSIHAASPRADGPFVAVACGALPETLLESELFGYDEGAFTGAKKGGKPGLFELAHGGTIFLDEIGEISQTVQSRLLRVLQAKEVIRVGGDRVVPVDVRVIAATNKDIEALVAQGKFRADLYYRLNVLRLHIPPLRERKEDIPELLRSMMARHLARLCWSDQEIPAFPEKFLEGLLQHDWPGNVRELENVAERLAMILNEFGGDALGDYALETIVFPSMAGKAKTRWASDDSLGALSASADGGALTVKSGTLDEMEQEILKTVYERCNGNLTAAAKQLGVSRSTIWRKLKRVARA